MKASFAAPILLALAAMTASACSDMKPSGGRPAPEMAVGFVLDPSQLALIGTTAPMKLRVRVYGMTGTTVGAQEGGDSLFDVAKTQDSYSVTGVHLGMKEFQLAILDANTQEDLGDGKIDYLVKEGAQAISLPVTIKVRAPTQTKRDLPLDLQVNIATDTTAVTTYLDVAPLLSANCTSCHSGSTPSGGIDLTAFDFKTTGTQTQTQLVTSMISDMKDGSMPDGGPAMKAADIAVFQKWLDGGLLKAPATDGTAELAAKLTVSWTLEGGTAADSGTVTIVRGTDPAHPFQGTAAQLIVQGKYDLTIAVIASDGTTTFTAQEAGVVVGDTGSYATTIAVPYTAPTVSIPIVITQ